VSEIILITGAAGGIGQSLCAQLARRDVQLVLADLNATRLNELCERLGPRAHAFPADLSDPEHIAALITFITQRFARLDVLINNAAIVQVGPFAERTNESIAQELNINLLAPLLLTRQAIPLLERSANARLITTVSVAGIFPTPESPLYCASKFGLRGAMLSLALDLKPKGIQVCCILPSATDTPMLRHEAVSGGNALQFMDMPQSPETVAEHIIKVIDAPCLESAPKAAELWLSKLLMLFPGVLPRLLPFLQSRGDRGLQLYLKSLEERGLAEKKDGKWSIVE